MLGIRKAAAVLAYHTGILQLLRYKNKNKVTILTIHSVLGDSDTKAWKPLRSYLSASDLDHHLAFLSRYYNFTSLADAVRMIRGDIPVKPYSLAITFDDGYDNNAKVALPVLKRYRAPATFFVCTHHALTQQPFWFDRLDYAIQHNAEHLSEIKIGTETVKLKKRNNRVTRDSVLSLIKTTLRQHKNDLSLPGFINPILESIEAKNGKSIFDNYQHDLCCRVMDRECIRQVVQDELITIGSHTHNHTRLAFLPPEDARSQVKESKRELEAMVGKPCDFICYPNGDFNMEAANIIQEEGYLAATTTQKGQNAVGSNPYTLQRINLPTNVTPVVLLATILGIH